MTTDNKRSGAFLTTRWSQVLRCRGETDVARAALGELCESYWHPVHKFIASQVNEEDKVRDLTQEFFARLLAGPGLDGVQPKLGRFRTYLLGAVKHFLSDALDRARAAKRGAGQQVESLPTTSDSSIDATPCFAVPPPSDALFDREWAISVMDSALKSLAAEWESSDRTGLFEALKPWLACDDCSVSQHDIAVRLGTTEGAIKVAIHRMRKRFRELVRQEISQTVNSQDEVAGELRYLIEALSTSGT
jgi:RNA polymerase sigma-70 factor (ECF subfamily)